MKHLKSRQHLTWPHFGKIFRNAVKAVGAAECTARFIAAPVGDVCFVDSDAKDESSMSPSCYLTRISNRNESFNSNHWIKGKLFQGFGLVSVHIARSVLRRQRFLSVSKRTAPPASGPKRCWARLSNETQETHQKCSSSFVSSRTATSGYFQTQ